LLELVLTNNRKKKARERERQMVKFRYTKMHFKDPEDMVFGHAVYPVSAQFDIQFGAGYVVPEIKVAPRAGSEKSMESLVKEWVSIITDECDHAVTIGFPAFFSETEHVYQQTNNPKWAGEIARAQMEVAEKYHDKYGLKVGVTQTVADGRLEERKPGLRGSDYDIHIAETVEAVAPYASDLRMETMGGKTVLDYGCMRNDIRAILFGIGVLGSIDMEYVWDRNVKILGKYKCNPAGDTNCSGANTLLFVAGGLLDKDFPHTVAALGRAISAARTIVAYECGAIGPGKDCAYEGSMMKAISGRPQAQEGKNATCAHCDLMGNLTAHICDEWSNESVFHDQEMGGTTPKIWLQATAMEAALMNTAIQTGNAKVLRNLYCLADKYRDPQALIMAYDNAYRIGQAIVAVGDDIYLRARAAALEAGKIIKEAAEAKKLVLTRFETESLDKAVTTLEELTTEKDKFIEECTAYYKKKVPAFDPKSYGL
jgi:methanol--5-hydroxybenzimidazolylcobamide Co-methyltransferase